MPAAVRDYLRRDTIRLPELLPWLLCLIVYFMAPDLLPLISQVLVMTILALSLDVLVGYAGIVSLGHAAFFGIGAYAAGMLAVAGYQSAPFALFAGLAVAAVAALPLGALLLRTTGLTFLMLTAAVPAVLMEAANRYTDLTGGADGLAGVDFGPLPGGFDFDIYGRTAYVLAVCVCFFAWLLVRYLMTTPYGRSLVGIRENPIRMMSLGVSTTKRRLAAYVIAAAIAGLAGALSTIISQFVSLSVFSFQLSGTLLVILAVGGVGRMYGAFIGAPLYVLAQDIFSKNDPVYWLFWLGLLLVVTVTFASGGILSLFDRIKQWRRIRAPVQPAGSSQ